MEAREYVEAMFKAMPVEQLIKVFNEYVTDTHAFRFPCIYEMDDEEKWEKMYQFYDVFDVVLFTAISSESGQFDVHKKYWLFEEDGQKLHSFDTTEELLKVIGTDAFVDTFYNMEYEYRKVRKGENEYVWWADIYKCDILVATACVVLPIAVSTTMVFCPSERRSLPSRRKSMALPAFSMKSHLQGSMVPVNTTTGQWLQTRA